MPHLNHTLDTILSCAGHLYESNSTAAAQQQDKNNRLLRPGHKCATQQAHKRYSENQNPRAGGTDQSIPEGGQLNKVHDFIHKGIDDFVGFPAGTQAGAEEEGLSDGGLGGVHIKLLHVPAHPGKGGLLLGVAVHHDVTLDDAACSARGGGRGQSRWRCVEGCMGSGQGKGGGGDRGWVVGEGGAGSEHGQTMIRMAVMGV